MRMDHPAKTVLVSATAAPYSSAKRRRIESTMLRVYSTSASRSPIGRDTIADISLRSRTKVVAVLSTTTLVRRLAEVTS